MVKELWVREALRVEGIGKRLMDKAKKVVHKQSMTDVQSIWKYSHAALNAQSEEFRNGK
jgi:predicted N-acetyltransferase YhbS